MFECFYTRSKVYLLFSILIGSLAFIYNFFPLFNDMSSYVKLFTVFVSFCYLLLFFKNSIYLMRALYVRNKSIKKIEKITKKYTKEEFLNFIENQRDLETGSIKESKKLNFFIKEIIYKGNFNMKTIATNIFNERFINL